MNKTSQLEYLIAEYVNGKRAHRNRTILTMALIDGYTYSQIAEALDMSDTQIGRIVRKYGDPLLLMLE